MIICALEQLPANQDQELRLWLGRKEVETLKRVVLAMEQRWECEGLTEVVQSKDFPDKLNAANASFQRAQRYNTFLQVLQELINQRDRFTTAKLT